MRNVIIGFCIGILCAVCVVIIIYCKNYFCPKPLAKSENYVPSGGYVADDKTAVRIAEAVWLSIYGERIYREKPFIAELRNGVWTVTGTIPEKSIGGVAEIDIAKKNGRILRVIHGK